MRTYHPPSGISHGLDFLISDTWELHQALAVIELLDDLRDRIWAHYERTLFDLIREDRSTVIGSAIANHRGDEPPF